MMDVLIDIAKSYLIDLMAEKSTIAFQHQVVGFSGKPIDAMTAARLIYLNTKIDYIEHALGDLRGGVENIKDVN